ncbi:MAG: ABC transporter permease [Lachnospiraceae bacterium]|nr:ABC transporter permease [Lachnospiraceae bacterium]
MKKIVANIKDIMGIGVAFLVIFLGLCIMSDTFFTVGNIITVLRTISVNAILSFGMTFIIIGGGIDLSVGSVMAFTSVMCAVFMEKAGLGISLSILCTLLIGTAIGTVNGFIITKMKMLPFITTLGISYIVRGITRVITNSKPITVSDESFYTLGNGYLGFLPLPVVYMFVIFLILSTVLYKSRYGRKLYAVGGNEQTAKFSGINVERTRMIAYALQGMLAAVAGIIYCSRFFSGQPTIGTDAEMDAIAATILGGTSFSGGIGRLGGTLVGALVLGILNNGLNLLGVGSYWQYVARGIIIIAAVFLDVVKNAGRLNRKKKVIA